MSTLLGQLKKRHRLTLTERIEQIIIAVLVVIGTMAVIWRTVLLALDILR